MPYEAEHFSLLVILPNKLDGLFSLLRKLHYEEVLQQAIKAMKPIDVNVFLPRIKIETRNHIKNPLAKVKGFRNIVQDAAKNSRHVMNTRRIRFFELSLNKNRYLSHEPASALKHRRQQCDFINTTCEIMIAGRSATNFQVNKLRFG